MSPFLCLEHTADIAYKVSGKTLEELFKEAARAWTFTVADISSYDKKRNIELNFSEDSYESLLVSFLSELNFLFLTKNILCYEIVTLSLLDNEEKLLSVTARAIDVTQHNCIVREEIKAITYHQLNIFKNEKGYETKLIFDV